MSAQRLRAWASKLRDQLAANARLRWGLLAILVISWSYGLMLVADELMVYRKQLTSLDEQLARLQPLTRERAWAERAEDARRQLAVLQTMAWSESDPGLVEAAFQDWLRATANRAGLNLRELTISRAAAAPSTAAPADAGAPKAGSSAVGPQLIKARLVTDFNRTSMVGFLSEVARKEKAVVVERLVLRLNAQAPVAEVDLRILAQPQAKGAP